MYTIDFIVLLMSGTYIYIYHLCTSIFQTFILVYAKIYLIFLLFVLVIITALLIVHVHAAMFHTKDLLKLEVMERFNVKSLCLI